MMATHDSGNFSVTLDEPINPNDKIGEGQYGAVYRVKFKGAACIAKRLHDVLTGVRGEEAVDDEQWKGIVAKFENECSFLSKLRHPNVVQFLGIYQPTSDPRDLVLVMEKLLMDLKQFVTKHPKAVTPLKLNILHGISCGLLYIHSHGIVHRDLNAGNVLLTEGLQAKVADLGVARIIGPRLTGELTQAPGAQDYMPPEALDKSPTYEFSLDVFSFGHLSLYLINGEYPLPRDPSIHSIQKPSAQSGVVMGLQAQKRKQWLDMMEDHCLSPLVVRCLQDVPEQRPTMAELNKEVEKHRNSNPMTSSMASAVLQGTTLVTNDELSKQSDSQLIREEKSQWDEEKEQMLEQIRVDNDTLKSALAYETDKVAGLEQQLASLLGLREKLTAERDDLDVKVNQLTTRLKSEQNSKDHIQSAFDQMKAKYEQSQKERGALVDREMEKYKAANQALSKHLTATENELRQCHRKIQDYERMIHQMRQQSSHVPHSQPPVHSTGQDIPQHLPKPQVASKNHSSAPVFVSNTGSNARYPPHHHSEQASHESSFDSLCSLPPPKYNEQQLRDMFQRQHHDREVAAQRQKMHDEEYRYHHRQQEERRDMERRGYDEEAARALREAEELRKQREAEIRSRVSRPGPVPRQPSTPITGPSMDTASDDTDPILHLAEDGYRIVCPKCGKRFHIGEIQKFNNHACPYKDHSDYYD